MKFNHIIAFATLASLGLTACGNDEEVRSASWENDPLAVRLQAEVGTSQSSRSNPNGDVAAQAEFNVGDKISVQAGTQPAVVYTLTNNSENSNVWVPAGNEYLKWEGESMSFSSFYPVLENKSGTSMTQFSLSTDQSTLQSLSENDYMTLTATKNKTKLVELNLKRQTALVKVNISKVNAVSTGNPDISDFKIVGYQEITSSGTTRLSDFTPYKVAPEDGTVEGTTYTALVAPNGTAMPDQPYFKLSMNGEALSVTGIPVLEAGNSYVYNLEVGKNTIIIADITVKPWVEGVGGELQSGDAVDPTQPFVDMTNHIVTNRQIDHLNIESLQKAYGKSQEARKLKVNGPLSEKDLQTIANFCKLPGLTGKQVDLDLSEITGLTELPANIFKGCAVLHTIILPTAITGYGDNAFEATGLNTVTIGKQVTTLGTQTYSGCTGLKSVKVVAKKSETISYSATAFSGLSNVEKLTVHKSWLTDVQSVAEGGFTFLGGNFQQVAYIDDNDQSIQFVDFDDNNFKQYMLQLHDSDKDGALSYQEAGTIQEIRQETAANWISLKGIEKMTDLRRLYIANNSLLRIDLSQNTQLEEISLPNTFGNEALLNLGKKGSLKKLYLNGYKGQLDWDFSGYSHLTHLDVSETSISSLQLPASIQEIKAANVNVAGAVHFETLSNLSSVDFSNCTQIESIFLGTKIQLHTLICEGCNQLNTLNLRHCTGLTNINLKGCTALQKVEVWRSFDSTLPTYMKEEQTQWEYPSADVVMATKFDAAAIRVGMEPQNFNGVTYEALVNLSKFNENNTIMGQEDGFLIRVGDNGIGNNQVQISVGNISENGEILKAGSVNSTTRLAANTWYHLAATMEKVGEGIRVKLFINGVEEASKDFSDIHMPTIGGTGEFRPGGKNFDCKKGIFIGKLTGYKWNDRPMEGMLKEVRVWNTVRTAEQIQANMLTIDAQSEGLEVYYKLNGSDISGNTVTSATGKKHGTSNGTITAVEIEDIAL